MIEDNVIKLDKPNYCGIEVFGSEIDDKDVGALFSGSIFNNQIHLLNGLFGININSKNFEVSGNKISGNAFFGIQTTGLKKSKDADLKFKDNDVSELIVREPFFGRVRRRRPTE